LSARQGGGRSFFGPAAVREPTYQLRRFRAGQHPADLCWQYRRHQIGAEVVTLGEGCTSVDAPSRGAHAGLEQRWGFHNDDTDHSAGVANSPRQSEKSVMLLRLDEFHQPREGGLHVEPHSGARFAFFGGVLLYLSIYLPIQSIIFPTILAGCGHHGSRVFLRDLAANDALRSKLRLAGRVVSLACLVMRLTLSIGRSRHWVETNVRLPLTGVPLSLR
jgi:hypothetical protein